MTLKERIRISAWVCLFLALIPVFAHSADLQVKVVVDLANVRLEAALDSQIIDRVARDTILLVYKKEGEWYFVKLAASEGGFEKAGYIHQSTVAEISEQIPRTESSAAVQEPPAQKAKPSAEPMPVQAQIDTSVSTDEKDLLQMKKIAKQIRRQSIAFLTIVKKMKPVKVESTQTRTVEMVRIIIDGCRVFEAMDEGSRVIFNPRINDEYAILEKNDGLYRIQLQDGRDGWIRESCIQTFAIQKEEKKIEFEGIDTKEINSYIEVAEQIFSRMVQDKTVADQAIDKYRDKTTGRLFGTKEIHETYADVAKYFDYAFNFYEGYIRNQGILEMSADSFLSRLSAWAEVLFGTTSFQTEFLTDPLEEAKGTVRDISVGGNLSISDSSTIQVQFSNKKDIIQSPYSNTTVDAGYSYQGGGKLRFAAGVNYSRYADEDNDFNNFNRMQLRGSADYKLAPTADFSLDYSYFNNDYTSDSNNSYASHVIATGLDLRNSSRSRFIFSLLSRFQSSKSEIHNLNDIAPSITYERKGDGSLLSLSLKYQRLDFSEIDLKDYSTLTLSLSRRGSGPGVTSLIDLALSSKSYPGNDLQSYVQVRGRYSRSSIGVQSSYFTTSMYTNFYANYSAVNFSDLRIDFGKNGASFFGNLSTSFRIWHSPGDETQGPVKPHVADIYAKLGIRYKTFRIGPTFGAHALLSSEEGVDFLKRDGNLIRFGGMAEGTLSFPHDITLRVSGAYEYGMVYNETIAIDSATGDFLTGDLLQRHPTTLQIDADLNAPLFSNLELIGRASYYKINTDMDAALSINPVTSNSRFILVFGIRYRYN
ncbi:MAG: hypothetical protein JXB23_07280 [Candidatus Aminicenantes bacterium]|nr:hypothetical protein [Candidatus Aminicenantes bacterium]